MTDIPTPALSEPARVSDERLKLIRYWYETQCPACSQDFVRDLLNWLDAARQQLAEMRGVLAMNAPWPLHDVLSKLCEAVEHLLTHHGCDTHGHENFRAAIMTGRALLPRIEAAMASPALAPTSQPSRGKCETCGDTGKVKEWIDPPWPVGPSGRYLDGYEVEKPCPKCPAGATSSIDYAQRVGHEKLKADCAQPERQPSPALREPERVLTQQERDGLLRAHRRSVVTVDPPPDSAALREAANMAVELRAIPKDAVRSGDDWLLIQRVIALLDAFAEGK